MEQTLGKRIAGHRRRLGLTQDQLAEQLGITAQAVSKWEHDQSCPDITMLPRLARIFGTTTDALLGIEHMPVQEGEVVTKEADTEPEGLHVQFDDGHWDFQWGSGRKGGIGLAVLALLVGGLLLAGSLLSWEVSFWGLLWPCALLVFGLAGVFPRFGFFRLGCVLAGGYFLAEELHVLPWGLNSGVIFPVVLLLLGMSLLTTALRKPARPRVHCGSSSKFASTCRIGEESFTCETHFGEDSHLIQLPRLAEGRIDCSFGDLTADLSCCEETAPGCRVHADCSFGNVTVLVPRRFRAEITSDTTFGDVEISGHPEENAAPLALRCDVSFGTVTVRYI